MRIVSIVVALTIGLGSAHASAADSTDPQAPPPASSGPPDPCSTTLAVVTRPSVTTSVCTVKSGHVVIETGYQNTSADGGGQAIMVPQTLVRAGTRMPNLEISVAPPQRVTGSGSPGSSDAAFGAKYEIGYSSRWLYGVNAFVTVPSGLNSYSANGTGYTANLNLGYSISPGLSLAGTYGYNSLSDGSRRYPSIVPSLVISSPVTSSTTVFGEIATFSHALGPAAATRVQYLAGVARSLANKLQLDIEAGRSPTVATGKYRYVGAGASYAF